MSNFRNPSVTALDSNVKAVKVMRGYCGGCGRSQGWWPTFEDALGDKGDCCHVCGTTWMKISPGRRPIGRRSRNWPAVEEWVLIALSVADESPGLHREIEEALIRA